MSVTPFTPMTKEDVAEVIGVSIRTIENLVKAGKMPAPGHIGGRVLWHPQVFYAWLDKALRASCSVTEAPEVSGHSHETPDARQMDARGSDAVLQPDSLAPFMSTVFKDCTDTSDKFRPTSKPNTAKAPKLSASERMKARQARKLRLDEADEAD